MLKDLFYQFNVYLFSVVFKKLIHMCEPQTKEQLFKTHGERLLNELNDSCDSWVVHSPGREVLDKIALDAGN